MGKIIDFNTGSTRSVLTGEQIEQQFKRFCARVGVSPNKLYYKRISETEIRVFTDDKETKEILRSYGIELHDNNEK